MPAAKISLALTSPGRSLRRHYFSALWTVHKHHHVFYNPSPFAVIADEYFDQFVRSTPLLLLPLAMVRMHRKRADACALLSSFFSFSYCAATAQVQGGW